MREIVIRKVVYSFEELSEEAKKIAKQKYIKDYRSVSDLRNKITDYINEVLGISEIFVVPDIRLGKKDNIKLFITTDISNILDNNAFVKDYSITEDFIIKARKTFDKVELNNSFHSFYCNIIGNNSWCDVNEFSAFVSSCRNMFSDILNNILDMSIKYFSEVNDDDIIAENLEFEKNGNLYQDIIY